MRIAFSGFFFILFFGAFSQTVELKGAIILEKMEIMSYMITYDVNENNRISGYSISDLNGETETKASISGVFNPRKKTLSFEEKKIIHTKTGLPSTEFCLMKVDGRFEKKAGKNVFTGKFRSSSLNPKLYCDSGTIILTTIQDIYDLAVKASKVINNIPVPDSLKKGVQDRLSPLKDVDKVVTLVPGVIKEYPLLTDSVQLDILDDRLEDGDRIHVSMNRTRVLSDFETTNDVKTLKFGIPALESVVVFTFTACNEGVSPPNTLKVVLTNGNRKELLIAQLKKDQSVKIMLKRK